MTAALISWYAHLGGRKFILCAGFGLIFSALFVWANLSEPAYQFLMGGTVLVYVAGNVTQKATAKLNRKGEVAVP